MKILICFIIILSLPLAFAFGPLAAKQSKWALVFSKAMWAVFFLSITIAFIASKYPKELPLWST